MTLFERLGAGAIAVGIAIGFVVPIGMFLFKAFGGVK